MANITEPVFTDDDIEILEKIDEEKLQNMIDFIRDYKVVMWRNNDTGELVKEGELPFRLQIQPLPEYPEELLQIGSYFSQITKNGRAFLEKEGFFTRDSLAAQMLGTMFSPNLICTFFADAYYRDRFCDGLLGFGVSNNLYLKMLLRLQDCKKYYEYTKKGNNK